MGEIRLSQEFDEIIQKQIESGNYESAADVISAALALLDEVNDRASELSREINDAFDDGSEGIALDDAFAHIEQIYLRDMKDRA